MFEILRRIGGHGDQAVPVPAEIHELEMWCDRRLVKLARLGGAGPWQHQRGAHTVQRTHAPMRIGG